MGRQTVIDPDEFQQQLPAGVAIGAEIHDGGQRRVYSVDRDGAKAVLKLMPAKDRERAEREVSIGCTFDHPNLVRILDQDIAEITLAGEAYVWFCEEFIEGEVLSARSGRYTPCEALALSSDLIAAVDYLWEQHDVVHRDIKPPNIIRRPDSSYVLIDVGIGRHQGNPSITSGPLGPGTLGHLAPEQFVPNKGRMLDARTDLFLIGIVLFEVLTDVLPFRPSDPDYHPKLLSGDWPRPQGLPPSVMQILERLLGRHPHQRPSLGQAKQMIADAQGELGCS